VTISIDVWSDIACPWCWIGKRRLEQALEAFGQPARVVFHAFELDPNAPTDADPDVAYVERLAAKYGVPRAEAQAMIDRMTALGAEVGLDMRFDRARPTNTFEAHRLLAWALEHGRQEPMKERLFRAYLSEGRDLADRATLVELAADVELPSDEAERVLASGAYSEAVRRDEAQARHMDVSGVPFFVVAERYGVMGAQPAEVLQDVLLKVAAVRPGPQPSGPACEPEGC
jgi:predicted DsbA family dithiol-disulfide isomerase